MVGTLEQIAKKSWESKKSFIGAMNRFYDSESDKWYVEAAKHLVPTYTLNKMSDTGSEIITIAAGAIEVGKIVGYSVSLLTLWNFVSK